MRKVSSRKLLGNAPRFLWRCCKGGQCFVRSRLNLFFKIPSCDIWGVGKWVCVPILLLSIIFRGHKISSFLFCRRTGQIFSCPASHRFGTMCSLGECWGNTCNSCCRLCLTSVLCSGGRYPWGIHSGRWGSVHSWSWFFYYVDNNPCTKRDRWNILFYSTHTLFLRIGTPMIKNPTCFQFSWIGSRSWLNFGWFSQGTNALD